MKIRGFSNLSKKLVTPLLVAGVILGAYAEKVSSGLATRAVNTLIALNGQMDTPIQGTVASIRLCTTTNGAAFYVAKLTGGGFVVMSTDTEIDPVIAISPAVDLVEDPRNPLWALLVSDMAARQEAVASKGKTRASSTSASSAGKAVTSAAAARWARLTSRDTGAAGASTGKSTISDVRVAPLLKTKWGQSYAGGKPCFNYYTPYGYVCGCTATAAAQLLRYHKFPTEYVEPDEYPCKIDGWDETLYQYGGWYDWDNMPEVPGRGTTDEQREAIGRLTYDVGLAVHSEYTQYNTTGYADYVLDLLQKWGYAHATYYWFRSFHPFDYDGGPQEGFTEDEMKSVMIPNLDAKLPVFARIYNKYFEDDTAHFVVADGYGYLNKQWSVHLNLGWDGNSDAWYVPPEFSAGRYTYTTINRLVANIYPDGPSSAGIVSGRVVSSTTSKPASGIVVAARNDYGEVEYATTDANGIYSFILSGSDGMDWSEDKWPDYDYDWDGDDYLDDDRYGHPDGDAGEPWEIYIEDANASSYSRNIRDGENHYGLDFAISIHTVKLDANGGKVTPATIDVVEDGMYGELPMPSRKGYVFAGWWTAKDGGEHITTGKIFDAADFAGQKTFTLYAHWLQLKKVTLKDMLAYASWELYEEDFNPEIFEEMMDSIRGINPDFEGYGELDGKGVMEVLPGARVFVYAPGSTTDKKENKLVFQKWTVTPSKADFGSKFLVASNETEFTMPSEDVTLQATYIDQSICGWVYASVDANAVNLGWDDEAGKYITIEPPYAAFEWSPDGGKTWYKTGYWDEDCWVGSDGVLLKKGTYTVTWRSTDPRWAVQSATTKMALETGSCGEASASVSAHFTYNPQVVVDVVTVDRYRELSSSSVCGTVTMNPKDGIVQLDKALTLTAKAAKDFAFQGWAFAKYWEYGDWFRETAASWKLEDFVSYPYSGDPCVAPSASDRMLYRYINPSDGKVHVVAVFKAVGEYLADDIQFNGFAGLGGAYVASGNEVTIRAVVGCTVEKSLSSSPLAGPLTYKLNGKLPDGLKFNAKTGVLSGVPKKAGKSTVTITASDPAKNSQNLMVNISVAELPGWLGGDYRGSTVGGGYCASGYCEYDDYSGGQLVCEQYIPERQNGLLELSVKSDGKVSAKVITSYGSRAVSGSLVWRDPEASYEEEWDDSEGFDDEDAEFWFWHTDAKDDSWCHVAFLQNEETGAVSIRGYADSYDKKEDDYAGGSMAGCRQDMVLFDESNFRDKYYTFAFCATTTACEDESQMRSGYGYLTLKTDKKGVAKVTGQLPDGEKVSLSALVMPCLIESESAPTTDNIAARLYLFASPSSYKKLGWFAMQVALMPDGHVVSEAGAAWTTGAGGTSCGACSPNSGEDSQESVSGEGALYSEAATLANYYWNVRCAWSDEVRQQYSYKYLEENEGNPSKPYSSTAYEDAEAQNFDGFLFNVAVQGDSKGTISLVEKNNALSFSFAKATGFFTGKATVYFDYDLPSCKLNSQTKEIEWSYTTKHTTATLPYAGVMIADGKGGYVGCGAAVHAYKYSYEDENGKTKTDTEKVSLPVSLESPQAGNEEP